MSITVFSKKFGTGQTFGHLKKVYEKCKPAMQKKFGRVLTFEEFCQTLAYIHEKGMVD